MLNRIFDKRRETIEIKPLNAIYVLYLIILGLAGYFAIYTMHMMTYIRLDWPYNWYLMGGVLLGLYGLTYLTIDNWFEGWATHNRRARSIQFTQCALNAAALTAACFLTVFVLNYLGGNITWLFYARAGIVLATMIVGISLAQSLHTAVRPAGLMKAKRG